jgi:hypothetical protein
MELWTIRVGAQRQGTIHPSLEEGVETADCGFKGTSEQTLSPQIQAGLSEGPKTGMHKRETTQVYNLVTNPTLLRVAMGQGPSVPGYG